MRRLCRLITGAASLTALVMGCGSTGQGDRLVFTFERWDTNSLSGNDVVLESSAQVDVSKDCCTHAADGTCTTVDYTPTVINAVFRNQEAADMHLEEYAVQVNDSALAQAGRLGGPPTGPDTQIIGGRCSGSDTHCAVDADCVSSGTAGSCVHTDTTVTGLLLFDLQAKDIVFQIACGADGICRTQDDNLQVLNRPVSITVTFFATDDATRSFEATANYTVTFSHINTCTGTGPGPSPVASTPTSTPVRTNTPTPTPSPTPGT
jgi:hypothetical protein